MSNLENDQLLKDLEARFADCRRRSYYAVWPTLASLADDEAELLARAITAIRSAAGQEPTPSVASEQQPALYVIIKRGLYYRPNSAGYTSSLAEAGLYTLAVAQTEPDCTFQEVIADHDDAGKRLLRDPGGLARLKLALQPSGNTKYAYLCRCEFKFDLPMGFIRDCGGNELGPLSVAVPWTTIKEIMGAIADEAGVTIEPETSSPPDGIVNGEPSQ